MNSKDIKNLSKLTEALRGRKSHTELNIVTVHVTQTSIEIVNSISPLDFKDDIEVNHIDQYRYIDLSNISDLKILFDNFLYDAIWREHLDQEHESEIPAKFDELLVKFKENGLVGGMVCYLIWYAKSDLSIYLSFTRDPKKLTLK